MVICPLQLIVHIIFFHQLKVSLGDVLERGECLSIKIFALFYLIQWEHFCSLSQEAIKCPNVDKNVQLVLP